MSTERRVDAELIAMIKADARKPKEEPTTLLGRYLMEADDETNDDESDDSMNEEDDGEDLENIENDLDGLDGFGENDSDEQNEYDPDELDTLNELIADEQKAMRQYFEAGKKTKSPVLSRLYSDIGAEESFHSEQLLYAKSELTGEKYEPSDPEVKKEYEELLENGMDEETAINTIADKHRLSANDDEEEMDAEDIEDIEKDLETLEEGFVQSLNNCELLLAIQESGAYKNHSELRQAYADFAESMFMEAMDNVSTKQGQKILGTNNPFLIIGKGIKTVYTWIINMVKKIKNFINKRRIKSKRTMAWLKKHGIKGLFADGFKLYFWNDETGSVEVSDAIAYMNLCIKVTSAVASQCKINPPQLKGGVADGNWTPQNMGSFANIKNKKSIAFTSLSDGAHKIDGVVFSKSKVIVTDHNQSMLENLFFGISGEKFVTGNKQDGIQIKSQNIYNAFNYILEWAGNQLKATDEWMNELQNISSNPKSIFYKKPELFKECVAVMKSVTKGYTRLMKCLSSDIQACMKLDQSLLNAVNAYDKAKSEGQVNVPLNDVSDSEGNIRFADKLS